MSRRWFRSSRSSCPTQTTGLLPCRSLLQSLKTARSRQLRGEAKPTHWFFKATLPSTSLMQVQRGTAVLVKRELESLIGQAAQGLYSGERHATSLEATMWIG